MSTTANSVEVRAQPTTAIQGDNLVEEGARERLSVNPRSALLTQDEIAAEAYALWASGGYQDGHDVEHWLEAERQLRARRTGSAGR
jgi:hypothetical protein